MRRKDCQEEYDKIDRWGHAIFRHIRWFLFKFILGFALIFLFLSFLATTYRDSGYKFDIDRTPYQFPSERR
jgi:hypothetical protein